MRKSRKGINLIEVALSVAIGMIVMAGTVAGYRNYMYSARWQQARTIVGTVQTNLGMSKFRRGTPLPYSPAPSQAAPSGMSVVPAITTNRDDQDKALYPLSDPGQSGLPVEPIGQNNFVMLYDASKPATPLTAGDATNLWDNPCFVSPLPASATPSGYTLPSGAPGYGKGGYLYDPSTGSFRINYSNKQYQDQRPGAW